MVEPSGAPGSCALPRGKKVGSPTAARYQQQRARIIESPRGGAKKEALLNHGVRGGMIERRGGLLLPFS